MIKEFNIPTNDSGTSTIPSSPKVYPIWNGVIISDDNFHGYTNLGAAKKSIEFYEDFNIPSHLVYEQFGGKDAYIESHRLMLKTNETLRFRTNLNGEIVEVPGLMSRGQWYNKKDIVQLLNHPDKDAILKDLADLGSDVVPVTCGSFDLYAPYIEFEKKWGLYPQMYIDWDDFSDAKRAIKEKIKAEVKYMEGTVESAIMKINFVED